MSPNDSFTLQGRRLFLPGGPQESMRSIGPPSMVSTCATDALPMMVMGPHWVTLLIN